MIHHGSTERKAVAFTFDDGPNPVYTPQILDLFRQAGAKATFYMIGSQIESNPKVAKAVHEQGHEIGNHTFTHPHLSELPEKACFDELARTEALIEEAAGTKPQTFRPPYLDCNEQVAGVSAGFGYAIIGAVNSAARDWEQPGVQHIIDKTREAAKPGSIFVFHDGFGDRSQTVEAVRALIAELTAEGYELVTVSELLNLNARHEA